MQEFIIPEDGIVFKTSEGRSILELAVQPEGSILRLFDADGCPKVVLSTDESGGFLFLGDTDPDKNNIFISVNEDLSEIGVNHSGKNITLAINETNSELSFRNENNNLTNKIYVDENGGQMGFSDNEGNLLISLGAAKEGGIFLLDNTKSETVILLESKEGSGNITLLNNEGNIQVILESKDDGNMLLLDKNEKIILYANQKLSVESPNQKNEMTFNFCHSCGNEILDNTAKFCENCGVKI